MYTLSKANTEMNLSCSLRIRKRKYLEISEQSNSTVNSCSSDNIIIMDKLSVVVGEVNHQVNAAIFNQSGRINKINKTCRWHVYFVMCF